MIPATNAAALDAMRLPMPKARETHARLSSVPRANDPARVLETTPKPVFPICRGLQLTLHGDFAIRIRDIEAIGRAGHGGCDG